MRKLSRTDPKARHPREWLGREESSGIRRLVSHSYIPVKNHRVTGENLIIQMTFNYTNDQLPTHTSELCQKFIIMLL